MPSHEDRTRLLDLLSDVKVEVQNNLGQVDFPMPQFIVLGRQSVGKSRLVEALAGEQFNFVSGTLGSRRPTVLEFRNVADSPASVWSVFNAENKQWETHATPKIMEIIGNAHESLGESVTTDPVFAKVEGPHCVDMQITDLPGFRSFSMSDAKSRLADQIEKLNQQFMNDDRNVMLCVDEAGDAANLATLDRCRKIDPYFKRTILVRTKLDKYYSDLQELDVEKTVQWIKGHGDLPPSLIHFEMTLPHWGDSVNPPNPFVELRESMDKQDTEFFRRKAVPDQESKGIGYKAFAKYMETRTEQMFAQSVTPVLNRLRDMLGEHQTKADALVEQLEETDARTALNTVRQCGGSFARALEQILLGQIHATSAHHMSLDKELREFHEHHTALGSTFKLLPTDEFADLEDYIAFLRDEVKLDAFKFEISGGAQWKRMMEEIELFLRFSEMSCEVKKKDVIQARGVSVGAVTWREVIVKLLSYGAHLPMKDRVRYAGERIKWYYIKQKEVTLSWMLSLKGSASEHIHPKTWTKDSRIIQGNEMIRHLIWEAYDKAVDRQLTQFIELFNNTLASTFTNPWVFLKKTSMGIDDDTRLDEVCLPSFQDTKLRIPNEIEERSGIETYLTQWLTQVPMGPSEIDDAVDRVQMLVLRTYAAIRAQISDQIELFAESFFKLPMMNRLSDDMYAVELDEEQKATMAELRKQLEERHANHTKYITSLTTCVKKLQDFKMSQSVFAPPGR
jgi:GTP-binding protein EngB required for normal cell division